MPKKWRIVIEAFKDWVLRARVKIPSTPIPTFASLWFASASIVRVRVCRSGRSGGSEQPQGEVRQELVPSFHGPFYTRAHPR